MNQILISEKVYITPELKKKKRMYKIDFFMNMIKTKMKKKLKRFFQMLNLIVH